MKRAILRLQMGLLIFLCLALPFSMGVMAANGDDLQANQPLVTGVYFDSDLREALKEISLQTGVPIIMDENVKGIVTLELKNVPLEKALKMLIIGGGFSYHKVDDFYLVGLADPKNPAFLGLCDFAIYSFQNINAESAKALLPAAFEAYVKIDPVKNVANLSAPPELLQLIIEDLKKIDGEKKQIRVKALVTEVRQDVLKEWGIDLLRTQDLTPNYVKSTSLDITNGLITINGLSDFGSIYGNIKAMVNDKKASIQADPVVVVTEGKTGELFVGDQRTLLLTQSGSTVASAPQNIEAGITLKVTPRVYDGQIELTIGQKVSSFDDLRDADQILVRTTEFDSVVRFKPGQTILIAELTAKNNSNNVSKTPILGDIPLIRLFFRQKTDQKNDSQLLIFITAEILK